MRRARRARTRSTAPKGRRRRASLLPKRCREEIGRVRTALRTPSQANPAGSCVGVEFLLKRFIALSEGVSEGGWSCSPLSLTTEEHISFPFWLK